MEEKPVLTLEEFEEKLKAEERPVFKNRTIEDLRPFVEKANLYEKPLLFEDCDISEADLADARVKVEFSVFDCRFLAGADFESAEFSGKADFWRAEFSGGADFRWVKFSGEAEFWEAEFKNPPSFSFVEFFGKASFLATLFSGSASFLNASFHQDVSFNEARKIGFLDISGATIEKRFVAENIQEENFGTFRLHKALINGRLFLPLKLVYDKKNKKAKLKNELEKEYEFAAEEYGLLYDNYKRIPHYEKEIDHAYYKFREMDRLAREKDLENKQGFEWLKERIRTFLNKVFFDYFFGYGVKLERILLTALGAIIFFGLFYSPFTDILIRDGKPLSYIVCNDYFWGLSQTMYFSVITFATIGYGDLSPAMGWLQAVCGFEGLLGLFIMAVFVVAFSRKLLR